MLEIEQDIERTKRLILEYARKAIDEDGAEAILLGCAGLGPIDKTMEEELGVPVLDGVRCAVTMIEGLHTYGRTTSKTKAFLSLSRSASAFKQPANAFTPTTTSPNSSNPASWRSCSTKSPTRWPACLIAWSSIP